MKPLAPNTMIQGRYLVVQLIGKGGMGEVYLAVDQRLGSAVAVKRTSFAEDALLAAAFEREAKILARLRHPVLPKVSDHFVDNGEQYLVMEHISGDDLSKRLENAGKPFPISWVMFWADQLLDALSYLHSHEPPIIHRDIKPQNLKLSDENHIVLLDFGLSKDTANQSVISKSGTSGSVVGYTPHFAPMEQIRGTGTNPRSDVYALSATLYQLMTDTVPADALTRADAMLNQLPDPIRPLSEINPEISEAVSSVILKGLAVTQEKRFPTASEMQRALRSAYVQMQSQMSADTVAFNVADHAGADIHSTSPPIDHGRSVAPSEMATPTPSIPRVSAPGPVTAASSDPMDATIRMGEPHVTEAFRQADVQTEVYRIPDIADVATPPSMSPAAPQPPVETENIRKSPPVTRLAQQTADLVAAGGNATNAIGKEQVASQPYSAPATVAAINLGSATAASVPSAASSAQKGTRAASGSRLGLIIGGLAAVLVLVAAAVAGGLYYYSKPLSAVVVKPSPVVTASPSPEPSVAATQLPTPSPDVSTSNAGVPSPLPTATATPAPQDAVITKPTPQTAPTRNVTTGTKIPTQPVVKATPKPKAGNDRTVILQ